MAISIKIQDGHVIVTVYLDIESVIKNIRLWAMKYFDWSKRGESDCK